MQAPQPQKRSRYEQPEHGFVEELQEFEKSLEKMEIFQSYNSNSETNWAQHFTNSILSTVEIIVPQASYSTANLRTRVNALHIFMDLAMAVAYAPRGVASDLIRGGKAPSTLIDSMSQVLDAASVSDLSSIRREEAFLAKVNELRFKPRIVFDGASWTGLDKIIDLLTLKKGKDFRPCCNQVKSVVAQNSYSPLATQLVKTIRREIVSSIQSTTTFETKCNALNALADISLLLTERQPNCTDRDLVSQTLREGLLKVTGLMTSQEIAEVVADLRTEFPEFSQYLRDDAVATYVDISKMKQLLKDDSQELGLALESGKGRLLAKLLYLKYVSRQWPSFWAKDLASLDQMIELFIDNSGAIPISCKVLLLKITIIVDAADTDTRYTVSRESAANRLRVVIGENICRLAKRGGEGSCMETKLDVLKTLLKIGRLILEWKAPSSPEWKSKTFKDDCCEKMLATTMTAIRMPFDKTKWAEFSSEPELREEIVAIDELRKKNPAAMPDIDSALNMLRDPSNFEKVTTAARGEELVEVVDLTDD
ncbi:hypothetical protein B0J14DRAFT_476974 [Halenospora varia]|nr:hypothetical protein B0J14DRAFT_476974 [Halenospora varia]